MKKQETKIDVFDLQVEIDNLNEVITDIETDLKEEQERAHELEIEVGRLECKLYDLATKECEPEFIETLYDEQKYVLFKENFHKISLESLTEFISKIS